MLKDWIRPLRIVWLPHAHQGHEYIRDTQIHLDKVNQVGGLTAIPSKLSLLVDAPMPNYASKEGK